jgi:hemerythrin
VDFFVWKDSFCIGIEELDRQHRSFLYYLNDCYWQASKDSRARVDATLLKRLRGYAAQHFRFEEGMMRQYGYSEMVAQERQHQYFVSQLDELEKAQAAGGKTTAQSVLTFLRDWFLEHVLTEDRKFAAVVAAARKGTGSQPPKP